MPAHFPASDAAFCSIISASYEKAACHCTDRIKQHRCRSVCGRSDGQALAVELLHVVTLQPGKYLVLIGGGTAEVEESYREGMQTADAAVLDEVFLPQVHPQVVEALEGVRT